MSEIPLEKVGRCRIRRCDERIAIDKIACRRHWELVPEPLKQAVYAAWRARRATRCRETIDAHRAVVDEALAAVEARLAPLGDRRRSGGVAP